MKNTMKNTMKKPTIIGIGILIALLSLKASGQTKGDISGTWYAEEMDQSTIEVTQLSDGSYEGIIRSSAKNEFVGHKVIYDFEYDSDEKDYKGTINSAARNMELDGTIVLEEKGKLKITGKKFFMTKTFYWTKEKDYEK
ncbi:MAG: DUF2147 domain-containing protein [Reichenbachiella sp.]|uniref:DUF2147 domain-containing protein n=1 Tax=Reichenbachiella sp. TaxID=2184521 RepID=UPI0029675EBD|nr:DUF2147 domain-containing protein [Reichenbachiella sp.]MDW3209652.1 DUF2147 domain-containing protein [Reichenbachiella sp.]